MLPVHYGKRTRARDDSLPKHQTNHTIAYNHKGTTMIIRYIGAAFIFLFLKIWELICRPIIIATKAIFWSFPILVYRMIRATTLQSFLACLRTGAEVGLIVIGVALWIGIVIMSALSIGYLMEYADKMPYLEALKSGMNDCLVSTALISTFSSLILWSAPLVLLAYRKQVKRFLASNWEYAKFIAGIGE